jgi:O-antigen ligase
VTEIGKEPGASWLSVIWSARHDPDARMRNVDLLAVLVAALLPWSTSGVGIALALWLIALAFTVEPLGLLRSLARPICVLPIAFFALALVGTLWSDASWSARLHGISPLAKFLALPLIFYHFERSPRGAWVFVAFPASCALLAAMSCIAALDPDLSAKLYFSRGPYLAVNGVFVKNYIDQGQEFTLCAVALAYPVATSLREGKTGQALLLTAVALWLLANMLFVVVSRTALVTMPIMLAVFALLHLRWRAAAATLCAAALLAAAVWYASSSLRATLGKFVADYQQSEVLGNPSGMGSRLEYWKKSLRFVTDAPLIGHGTGSTRGLFERSAVGQVGVHAEVVGDPHNQTLNVAVQWGAVGVVLLYAMWFVHLSLFRGEGLAAWIGLLVVVQNIFTSLLNSHLFDFNEGWLYVLGVGIAGGMTLGREARARAPGESGFASSMQPGMTPV